MSYQYQPLGTIIASILNYDQLCNSMGETPSVSTNSSYAPCDGRPIAGSQLDIRTNHGIIKTPDLRGKFLRCVNEIYNPGEPAGFVPHTDGDPDLTRVIGGPFQADMVGPHTHTAHTSGNFAFEASGMGIQANTGQQVQYGPPSVTVDPSTGVESRPRNVAVYYYIKIN